jgi:hypothetical protein
VAGSAWVDPRVSFASLQLIFGCLVGQQWVSIFSAAVMFGIADFAALPYAVFA